MCIYIYKERDRERKREYDSNEFVRGKKINRGLWFHLSRGNLMQIYVRHNMPLTYIPHGRR